jgi:hypothetical protein
MRTNVMANENTGTGNKANYPFWVKVGFISQRKSWELFYAWLMQKITPTEFINEFFKAKTLTSNGGFSLNPTSYKNDTRVRMMFDERIEYVNDKLSSGEWDWEENKLDIRKKLTIVRIVKLEIQVKDLKDAYGNGVLDDDVDY